jgi:tetratricopeptide (TPR) repeat protein
MGRPEKSLDPRYTALQDLAAGLRGLRAGNGGRSYRQLARVANFAAPTLARAASGRTLPSWDLTRAYVAACGGDPDQWRPLWLAAARSLGRVAALPLPLRQLPADLRDFVGREWEFEALASDAAALAELGAADRPDPRSGGAPVVVVITGPGGIGKTTLAVHAAHQLAQRFPDGQLFADLRGYDDYPDEPTRVATRLIAALGGAVSRAADPITFLRSLTAGRRLLVLLDNVATEAQIAPLLPASSGCLVIVTSRHRLGGLTSARTLELGVFGTDEAVELLSRIAGRERAGQTGDTTSLVKMCGRYPLALRIAGARLASSPPGKAGLLVHRLRDEETRLRQLAVGDLDLSRVFALSYRSLPERSRLVFRYAGLFPGPDFTPEAVGVLAGITMADAEYGLEQLVSASLVQAVGVERYQMHDLLRLYALGCTEREEEEGHRSEAIRRLSAWYLARVDAVDRLVIPDRRRPATTPELVDQSAAALANSADANAWYDAEQANVVAATHAAARYGHHEIAWRLPVAMRGLLDQRGRTADWITTHRIGLESARLLGDREGEGWVLNGLGIGYWRREAYAEAIDCFEQALKLRVEAADPRGIAVVLNNLSNVYGAQGRHAEAMDCLREALAIHDSLGDEASKSFALHNLGHVYQVLGDYPEALTLIEEALRIRRAAGSRNSEAVTLHSLGDTLAGLGRHIDALACLRQALPLFREFGNCYGEAVTLHSIGAICRGMGRPDHAVRYLRRAIALYRSLDRHHRAEEDAAVRELAAVTTTN